MIRRLLLLLIRFYQLAISPYMGRWCRFEPSCSRYAAEALQRHSLSKGLWLSTARICRCHPFCSGGFDPVPPPKHSQAQAEHILEGRELKHG